MIVYVFVYTYTKKKARKISKRKSTKRTVLLKTHEWKKVDFIDYINEVELDFDIWNEERFEMEMNFNIDKLSILRITHYKKKKNYNKKQREIEKRIYNDNNRH